MYDSLKNTKPDLGLALEGAYIDVGPDLNNTFEEFGNTFKCWMVIKVHYEPVNPNDETHKGFDAYLSAAQTRIFKKDGIVNGWGNPYRGDIELLSNRIKVANSKFIRDKSGLVLAEIIKLYLKMASYQPLSGRSWKALPKFIENKKAVVNIKNTDNRCFGYALLFFLERPQSASKHIERPALYTDIMFALNNLRDLPYHIKPSDVSNYEDILQININVFSFFDDEGKARYPMVISRKNYARWANLLYWDGHYAPIKI